MMGEGYNGRSVLCCGGCGVKGSGGGMIYIYFFLIKLGVT